MKIRTKITMLVTGLMAAVVTAVAANVVVLERRKVVAESEARIDALLEGVLRIARESLSASDELMLLSYLKFLMTDYPELELTVVSRQGHNAVLGEVRTELFYRMLTVTDSAAASFRPEVVALPKRADLSALPPKTTQIQLGFSKTALARQIRAAQTALALKILQIAAVGLLLGLVGSLWVARLLSKPVLELAQAAGKLGEGQLDVEVRAKGRDEVADLARQFNVMAAKLRDSIRFKEDLLSTLTHELNNPLAGLKGFLALLTDAGPTQDARERAEAYQTMQDALSQMDVSLRNALDLFKAQAAPELRREPLELYVLAAEVLRLFAPAAQVAGIELVGPAPGAMARLLGDRETLRRIIVNLVSNAIKYTPPGGTVSVRLEENEAEARLVVEDTGPGIAPEDRDRIFTKFYRVAAGDERARRIPGSGLGLAIAKQSVDLHGGRIWVESVVGKGSAFHVALPRTKGAYELQTQR